MASKGRNGKITKAKLKPIGSLCDVKCPICFGILIKPVTTPCNHELCLECFNRNIEFVQRSCPVCRRRISVWVRQAVRQNTLVNNAKWKQIQKSFPDQVRRRMSGENEDEDLSEDENDAPAVHTQTSRPGEIRKEYEEFLKKFQEELERERKAEALASEQLIRELQRQDKQQMVEETLRRQHVTSQDEVLAKDICRQYIKSVRTRSRASCSQKPSSEVIRHQESFCCTSVMKGSLTSELLASLDKENTQFRSTSAESHDSISSEMCHFKPISAAPRTPPKRLPDGRFEEPEVVHTKPRRLGYSEFQSSKVLSIKIQAIMVDSQNKAECCSVPIHASGTPFINKKFSGARKPNIDLSFKENYPYYSGSGSQSLSPTKSVLTGANQNGATSARIIKNTRASKTTHKSDCNGDENSFLRKRKAEDKVGHCKVTRVDETDASTSASQPPSTNCEEESWAELQREALEKIDQEEKDRQLAMQLQEEFNRSLQRGQQGTGNQYFLRSQKKK